MEISVEMESDLVSMTSETRRHRLVKQSIANARPYDPLETPVGGPPEDGDPDPAPLYSFGDWLGKFITSVCTAVWRSIMKSRLVQRVWRNHLMQYLHAVYVNVFGIIFQVRS